MAHTERSQGQNVLGHESPPHRFVVVEEGYPKMSDTTTHRILQRKREPIMEKRTIRVNPSEETIKIGPLGIRFLLTGDDSSGGASAFEDG